MTIFLHKKMIRLELKPYIKNLSLLKRKVTILIIARVIMLVNIRIIMNQKMQIKFICYMKLRSANQICLLHKIRKIFITRFKKVVDRNKRKNRQSMNWGM